MKNSLITAFACPFQLAFLIFYSIISGPGTVKTLTLADLGMNKRYFKGRFLHQESLYSLHSFRSTSRFLGLGCQCVAGSIVRLDTSSRTGIGVLQCEPCPKNHLSTRDQRFCIRCPANGHGRCGCPGRHVLSENLELSHLGGGGIAQRLHLCFSPSSPGFESLISRDFSLLSW